MTVWLVLLSCAAGCAGGIYGIGGGSVLAPVLIGTGRPPAEGAPAALASTFVTSVAGVLTFALLAVHHAGPVAPTGRPASPSASAARPAAAPGPGSRPGCRTCCSGG